MNRYKTHLTVSTVVLCVLTKLLCTVPVYAEESPTNSTWSIQRDTDHPIFGQTDIKASLRETGVKKSLFRRSKYLGIRCWQRKLDAYVIWGGFMAIVVNPWPALVTIQLDSNGARDEFWSKDSEFKATVAPEAASFISSLRMHKRLEVQTYADGGKKISAIFDLSEARPITEEVLRNCGVYFDKAWTREDNSIAQAWLEGLKSATPVLVEDWPDDVRVWTFKDGSRVVEHNGIRGFGVHENLLAAAQIVLNRQTASDSLIGAPDVAELVWPGGRMTMDYLWPGTKPWDLDLVDPATVILTSDDTL